MNAERDAAGEERIINLGIGAPDGMPPAAAIEALKESASQPGNHAYQSYIGIPQLRKAFAEWYARYYGVALDPAKEIQPLVGSKEGILLISLAFLNPGDKVLVPDPGYPTYSSATALTEAKLENYKSVLQEYTQEREKRTPEYSGEEGEHGFRCTVSALGQSATAEAPSKKLAEQDAAKALYEILTKGKRI